MPTLTLNGTRFCRRGVRRGRPDPAGPMRWTTDPTIEEIRAGVGWRTATAAEARQLNALAIANPDAMSLPGAHPSYRV